MLGRYKMGFLGYGNYNKPGRGVEKNEPEKRAVFKFFELYFRKFWKIMNVALIYFFAAIPSFVIVFAATFFVELSFMNLNGGAMIELLHGEYMYVIFLYDMLISFVFVALIGAGPATAGLSYVLGCFADDCHAFIWQDFRDKFKENFKQSTLVFLIDLIVFVLLSFAFVIYYSFGGAIGYIRYIVAVIGIIFAAMHLYIYPMLVGYELKISDIYKNAFILTMGKLPVTLILLAIIIILHYAVFNVLSAFKLMIPIYILIEGFLLYGITGFTASFRANRMFKMFFNVKGEDDNGNTGGN